MERNDVGRVLLSSIVPQLLMWSLLTPHNLSLWYKSLSAVMILHYITACNSNHHQLYKVVKKKIVVKFYFNKHLNEVVGFYDYDEYINLITFYIVLELIIYSTRKNFQRCPYDLLIIISHILAARWLIWILMLKLPSQKLNLRLHQLGGLGWWGWGRVSSKIWTNESNKGTKDFFDSIIQKVVPPPFVVN